MTEQMDVVELTAEELELVAGGDGEDGGGTMGTGTERGGGIVTSGG